MLPMRHCGFGRHRFACPLKLFVGGRWRLAGPNKSCLPALATGLALLGGTGRSDFMVRPYLRFVFAFPERVAAE